MNKNQARERLKAGDAVVGTWLAFPCAMSARFMAQIGFDYLTVDMEHQPIDYEAASHMFAVISSAGCTALARVPWNTPENIKRVLDCGAHGIVIPMVNTAEEARAAVAAAKYPPQGIRSVGGSLHCMNFGADPATYYRQANDEILVVVQCESPQSVDEAEAIMSVPGVDAVFVGPNDLLCQMGKTPRMESDEEEFVSAMSRLLEASKATGVPAGIHTANFEACNRRIEQGFRFLAIASDARFMVAGASSDLQRVSQAQRRPGDPGEVLRY